MPLKSENIMISKIACINLALVMVMLTTLSIFLMPLEIIDQSVAKIQTDNNANTNQPPNIN